MATEPHVLTSGLVFVRGAKDADLYDIYSKLYLADGVCYCDPVLGDWDIVLLIQARNRKSLQQIVNTHIQSLDGVEACEVHYCEKPAISRELEEFIRLGMLDGMAMKPSRCGGLASNKRQIELVGEYGLAWLGSGLSDPDISLAAHLALYGAFGLKKPAALNGPQFLDGSVLSRPLVIRDGFAEVPRGPGLGVEVDEGKVAELVRRAQAAKKTRT